jgi:PRTRC genetic system protein E
MLKELRPILATGRPVMLALCQLAEDRLQVAVIPELVPGDDNPALCEPLLLTGSYDELDGALPQILDEYTAEHTGLRTNLDEVKAAVVAASAAARDTLKGKGARKAAGGATGAGATASRTTTTITTVAITAPVADEGGPREPTDTGELTLFGIDVMGPPAVPAAAN